MIRVGLVDDQTLVRSGLRGLLEVSFERLTEAIRAVHRGETIVRPAVTERLLRGLERSPVRHPASGSPEPLTRREQEVLRLMAGGYSNREIGTALGASEGTVKNHVSSILAKIGVRDRTRAVLKALELGWV